MDYPPEYEIRRRRPADDRYLIDIEQAAGQLFAAHGYARIADGGFASISELRAMMTGCDVFVTVGPDGAPVGFAVALGLGRHLHLRELSVHPAHGRKGLGSALVAAVVDLARRSDFVGVSLSTFRVVPFNQPFYARLEFVECPLGDAPPALVRAFYDELPVSVSASERILMVLAF